MSPLHKKLAIHYGVIGTLFSVLYVLGIYIIDESLFSSQWGGILVLLGTLILFIVAVLQFKKENGGYASFREAFSAFMLPFIFATVLGLVFNLTFYNFVDADLAARNAERQFVQMLEMPEDQRQVAMEYLGVASTDELHDKLLNEGEESKTVLGQLKGGGIGLVFFAIIGLIVAAVTKKNRPEFD